MKSDTTKQLMTYVRNLQQRIVKAQLKTCGFSTYLLVPPLVGLALLVWMAIAPVDAGLQYLTLLPAVTLAAVAGGFWPGMVTTVIGLVVANLVFAPPSLSIAAVPADLCSDLVFLLDGLVVSYAVAAMRRPSLTKQTGAVAAVQERDWGLDQLRKITSQVPGVVYQFRLRPDGSSCFPFASETIRDIYQVSPQEVREDASSVFSKIHPDDLAAGVASIQESARDLTPWCHEYRVKFDDGTVRWLFGDARPEREADGSVLWHGFITDITERKRLEESLRESEAHLRTLVQTIPDLIWLKDPDGVYLSCNPQFERFFGAKEADIVGKTDYDFVDLKLADFFRENDRKAMAAGKPRANEEWLTFADGGYRGLFETIKTPMRDAAGKLIGVLGIARDITERRQADADLRIAAIAFESHEGTMITDVDGVILRVNRAFTEKTGYTAEEAVGQRRTLLRSGRHDAGFYAAMWDTIHRTGTWQGEVWNRRKNGEVYPVWLTISAVRGADGAVTHYVGTHIDISERKAAEDQLHRLAFFDPLTQLPNRRLLLDRLGHALAGSARSQHQGAIMFIDLDNFKALNDTQGHDAGDRLLIEAALRLQTSVRQGDTVARLGGDEFVVMLENIEEDGLVAAQVAGVAEKILAALDYTYQLKRHAGSAGNSTIDYHCTASIGVTLFGGQGENVDELLKQADLAMYQAKESGRNAIRFFDPDMQASVTARVALEADLREAVQKGQFLLHYQPQLAGAGYRPTGAEALVRWQHPQRGMISPAEFIPLAEETGLILPLGRWVLEAACAQLAAWAAQPELAHLIVAVNVSAQQFRRADFVDQVLAVLADTGANPQRLKLELTESLLVDNVEDIITKMTALKANGVGFALDDFGTGYSSLSYLKRMPLDQLKIDQSFVRDVLTDPNDAAIAKMIVALAESLGLSVIAEGVETEGQRDFLARHGCHAYQGYLFSPPLPLAELEQFLMRRGV